MDDPSVWTANGVSLPEDGPRQSTGSGGGRRHYFYRLDGHAREDIVFNTVLPGLGAETKGDGDGYLVVSPSVTLGAYQWEQSGVVTAVPDQLYALLPRRTGRDASPVRDSDTCCAIPDRIDRDPGGHEWLLRRAGHLRTSHGLKGAAARAVLLACLTAMSPPYASGEGEREVAQILAYDDAHPERTASLGPDVSSRGVQMGVDLEPALAETDRWPEPLAEAAYHGVLGAITKAVAPHTEADPVGILGSLIAMFGSACGGSRWLYQGGTQRTNLSILLAGATGFGGRKGTALEVARDTFRLAYPDLDALWLVGVASGEAITGHLGRSKPEGRVLMLETEFGRLLTVMSREGSTLSAVLRNAWDGAPMGHARARDESLITSHHVTLLGHITPVELRTKLTDTDAANGFANRILFLAVRRQRLIPFPAAPDQLVAPYVAQLRETILDAQAPMEPGRSRGLVFDSAAASRWESFYAELAVTPRLGLAGAVTGRHEAQVARLALIYAVADRSLAIRVEHLDAAIALAEYARRSVVWALGDSTGNRHADVLRRMLVYGEVSFDDAKRALGLRTAADLSDAVGVLVDAGLAVVDTIPQPKGGRPRRVLRANSANSANGDRGARTGGSMGCP